MPLPTAPPWLLAVVLAPVLLFLRPVLRLKSRLSFLCRHRTLLAATPPADQKPPTSLPPRPHTLLVVLGSGGHTAEMLTLVSDLLCTGVFPRATPPRLVYLVTATDTHSATRAHRLHADASQPALRGAKVETRVVPRAREVGQGVLSSAVMCARCFKAVWQVLADVRPAVVLTNGPATGAVVGVAAVLRDVLWGGRCQVVYVESLARVETLSLSGKVLYPIADRFMVQWPELRERYPAAEYYGRLC